LAEFRAVRDEDFLAVQRRYKAALDACRDLADKANADELSARRFDVALEKLAEARDDLLAAFTLLDRA
jgi:hypothetical protein